LAFILGPSWRSTCGAALLAAAALALAAVLLPALRRTREVAF
jgi:hypothetical protein